MNNALYEDLAKCHPKIFRGQVWCTVCKNTQKVNVKDCFKYGWPECCGYTMTIDSPGERHE